MNIVFLDSYTVNPGDLNWEPLSQLGQLEIYDRTSQSELISRTKDADVIICNKTFLSKESLHQLTKLKCICVAATGYNNIDVKAAKNRGIVVCNAVGYSTASVAQHVFALILELSNKVGPHSSGVAKGEWANSKDWSYWKWPIQELAGQVIGIYGFGKIGRKVAQIALSFDMQVIAVHRHPQRDRMAGVTFVDDQTLFRTSNIISLHVPLSASTKYLINIGTLEIMKSDAILINTGRGNLVNETALRHALLNKQIAAAGLDVLSEEPPSADHPLIGLSNCIVTPHQAWASRASRQRLLDTLVKNIKAFEAGQPINEV